METLGDKIQPKFSQNSALKYYCKICDYGTYKKCNYDTHIMSAKHSRVTNDYNMGQNSAKIQPKPSKKTDIEKFICSCGKEYQRRQGLWRHSKNCNQQHITETINQNDDITDKELIIMLIKQNAELIKETAEFKNMMLEKQNIMMDVIKTGTHNTTNTNTNSHNKTFNLNFYLNETCKEALNINDFVSSIKVSLTDLENTGRQGYIEGISSIILKHLNNLEQYQRPIHCSDVKREVIYIKDNDKWEKEGEEKPLLTKAIKVIANENIKKIMEWKETNPDCTNSESKKNNLYLKIVSNSMNGLDKEEGTKNITKIISNVAKETIIQKEN